MSRFSVLCQLCLVNFVNLARLPRAARWGGSGWVANCRIELPMTLTQTVFLFYKVPAAISHDSSIKTARTKEGSWILLWSPAY